VEVGISIALVDRPKVSKSRLFNRLMGRKASIVDDQSDITREIIIHETKNRIIFIDTGRTGLSGTREENNMTQAIETQITFAIRMTDRIFCYRSTAGLSSVGL
jgi:GTP-binding protein